MPTELILNKQQYSSLIIKERCDSRTRSSPSLIIVGFSSSSQKIKRKGKKIKGMREQGQLHVWSQVMYECMYYTIHRN